MYLIDYFDDFIKVYHQPCYL